VAIHIATARLLPSICISKAGDLSSTSSVPEANRRCNRRHQNHGYPTFSFAISTPLFIFPRMQAVGVPVLDKVPGYNLYIGG
jgi:hypothetical protein